MSDQYYDHERMPAEDPHEELHALAGTIETLPPWDDAVQPLLVEAGQLLRSVYDDAEQRGDADAMHFIQASWQRQQTIAEQGRRANLAAKIGLELAKKNHERAQQAVKALETLTNAVRRADYQHPLVGEAAEIIITEHEEMTGESLPYDVAANWGDVIPHFVADDIIRAVMFDNPQYDDISPDACGYTLEGLIEFRRKVLLALAEMLRSGDPDNYNIPNVEAAADYLRAGYLTTLESAS